MLLFHTNLSPLCWMFSSVLVLFLALGYQDAEAVKCWLDHVIVGCTSNLYPALPKIVAQQPRVCEALAAVLSICFFHVRSSLTCILTPMYLLVHDISVNVICKRRSSWGACWCRLWILCIFHDRYASAISFPSLQGQRGWFGDLMSPSFSWLMWRYRR